MQKEKLKETKEGRKIKMDKMLRTKNGITLIALVVTIVILLILASVSISLVLDNNGIINRSKEARREYGQAKDNEQEQLNEASDWMDGKTNGNGGTSKPIKVGVNEKATSNGTINGGEGNTNNPTIPEGYTPINTDASNWGDGSSAPTQDSIDHGLVIKDDSNNEWVWVPVDSATLATMYETSSDAKTLCGTTGETAVTTNKYSKTMTIGKDSNTITMSRTTPGDKFNAHEPDLAVNDDSVDYDANEAYYKTILGFESKEKMAEAFVADYNEMLTSIGKYGGFYIGRYELSSAGVQKDKATLVKNNWYNLYKKCKELNASNKVETRMIWGCQWDVTCNFIANKGDKKSIRDSSSWGNYDDSTSPANTGNYEKRKRKNTGSNEAWKANNIYDLAGNCSEWTQEVNYTNLRAVRGGSYINNGSSVPASFRSGYSSDDSDYGILRFSYHFNNKVIRR